MSNSPSPVKRSELLAKLPRGERRELRTKVAAIKGFTRGFVGVQLRPYQLEAAEAIVKSVFARDGNSFVVIFARQSGKDELLADLILYLLARLASRSTSIVCAQPTFRPQTVNAMERLNTRAARRPFFTDGDFQQRYGYIYRFLSARVMYFSADPSASVVGPTADRLLIINEAQDVDQNIYDKRFAPMAAAGNATRVFSGTSWTRNTLLEREKLAALEMEKLDGLRRVFIVDAEQVARHNRLYGAFLRGEIQKLGRDHPLVRTQYFCENIDAQAGMFTAAHRSLMRGDEAPVSAPPILPERPVLPAPSNVEGSAGEGSEGQMGGTAKGQGGPSGTSIVEDPERLGRRAHSAPTAERSQPAQDTPSPNRPSDLGRVAEGRVGSILNRQSEIVNSYAFLLDVAGQEESSLSISGKNFSLNPARDAVTLRIVSLDLSTLETLQAPTYRVVHTRQWTGLNHLTVFGQLKALGESWRPQHIVIDATGVGEGLWAMLDKAFPTRVIPVKFTQQVKSELGYGFLAIINTGRFRDLDPSPETDRQYAACESEILIGPAKTMRWGVPAGRRDQDGRLIHDDIPITDSLTAILDRLNWTLTSPTLIVPARDPLDEMSHFHP